MAEENLEIQKPIVDIGTEQIKEALDSSKKTLIPEKRNWVISTRPRIESTIAKYGTLIEKPEALTNFLLSQMSLESDYGQFGEGRPEIEQGITAKKANNYLGMHSTAQDSPQTLSGGPSYLVTKSGTAKLKAFSPDSAIEKNVDEYINLMLEDKRYNPMKDAFKSAKSVDDYIKAIGETPYNKSPEDYVIDLSKVYSDYILPNIQINKQSNRLFKSSARPREENFLKGTI